MNLVIKKGTNKRGNVIIRNTFAETELGEVLMIEALWLILDQLPELFHLHLFPEFFSEILCLLQAAKKLFTGGEMTRRTRNDERSFGGKIDLSIRRGNQVQPVPLILEAISGDEVPLINILDDSPFAH